MAESNCGVLHGNPRERKKMRQQEKGREEELAGTKGEV